MEQNLEPSSGTYLAYTIWTKVDGHLTITTHVGVLQTVATKLKPTVMQDRAGSHVSMLGN